MFRLIHEPQDHQVFCDDAQHVTLAWCGNRLNTAPEVTAGACDCAAVPAPPETPETPEVA